MEFDFEQSGEVEDINLVPEAFRGAYTQDKETKKFVINDQTKGLVSAITGLNKALKNERVVSSTLKGQKDIGAILSEHFGVDKIEDAKAKFEELTNQVAEKSKIDPAKIKADIEKTYIDKEKVLNTKVEHMQSTLSRYLIEAEGISALNELKGNAKLLMPIIKENIKVVEDGDNYVVRVHDSQGDYRGNGQGGYMSVMDYIKELKSNPDYAIAFTSEVGTGHGKPGSQNQVPRQSNPNQTGNSSSQGGEKTAMQKISDGIRASRNR